MNEDEKTAWKELVARGVMDIGVQVHADYIDRVILAVDAEIKRLRKVANEILRYDMTIDGARMRLRTALKSAGEGEGR